MAAFYVAGSFLKGKVIFAGTQEVYSRKWKLLSKSRQRRQTVFWKELDFKVIYFA